MRFVIRKGTGIKGGRSMISELQVGVITQTHGIRGEVKVFPTTDDASRFRKLKSVIMDTGKERLSMEIEGVKFFKQYVIVKFKGYDSINEVERYKSAKLYVTREHAGCYRGWRAFWNFEGCHGYRSE